MMMTLVTVDTLPLEALAPVLLPGAVLGWLGYATIVCIERRDHRRTDHEVESHEAEHHEHDDAGHREEQHGIHARSVPYGGAR